jgi:hypothetical protein
MMPHVYDWVPSKYWQPIVVTCVCGREYGGHRIELWEPRERIWTGDYCGTLDIDGPHDVDHGTGGPGLGAGDKAPSSRLRRRTGDWPTWQGRCRHCGLDVRIRGDKLVTTLNECALRAITQIELSTIGEAAQARARR